MAPQTRGQETRILQSKKKVSHKEVKASKNIFQLAKIEPDEGKATYSKIGMSCSAHSSDGSILKCTLTQKDANTISIAVKPLKRKIYENDITQHASKRLKTENTIKMKSKATSNSRALVRTIANWQKPQPCKSVVIGEIVLCKMRGYADWPSRVTGFDGNLVCIEFFGDQTTHKAAVKNFFKFSDSYEIILFYLRTKKTPLYSKAVLEAEEALHIPRNKSILNQIKK